MFVLMLKLSALKAVGSLETMTLDFETECLDFISDNTKDPQSECGVCVRKIIG